MKTFSEARDPRLTHKSCNFPVCTPYMLKCTLWDYMRHGRPEHRGDWFHEWARAKSGTLSFRWTNGE